MDKSAGNLADQVEARRRTNYAIIILIGVLLLPISIGALLLMAVPLAHAVAGKHTDFTFAVSFSLNAALSVSTALASGLAAVQTRNAKHHKKRARELEKQAQAGK